MRGCELVVSEVTPETWVRKVARIPPSESIQIDSRLEESRLFALNLYPVYAPLVRRERESIRRGLARLVLSNPVPARPP